MIPLLPTLQFFVGCRENKLKHDIRDTSSMDFIELVAKEFIHQSHPGSFTWGLIGRPSGSLCHCGEIGRYCLNIGMASTIYICHRHTGLLFCTTAICRFITDSSGDKLLIRVLLCEMSLPKELRRLIALYTLAVPDQTGSWDTTSEDSGRSEDIDE